MGGGDGAHRAAQCARPQSGGGGLVFARPSWRDDAYYKIKANFQIMIKEERINILLSSDDNYARHMGVVIYSVLTTNTDVAAIRFFIVNNGISQENKEKITEIWHFRPFLI